MISISQLIFVVLIAFILFGNFEKITNILNTIFKTSTSSNSDESTQKKVTKRRKISKKRKFN